MSGKTETGGNVGNPVKPGRRILKLCKELGDEYSVRCIDGFNAIYRNFENGFDLEIAGIDGSRKQTCTIFLWRVKPTQHVEVMCEKVDLFYIPKVAEYLRLISVGILHEEEQKMRADRADKASRVEKASKEDDNDKK